MHALLSHYRAMAGYNRWMNERLYALAASLTDEDRKRNLGAFFGSIHRTFNHILVGDAVWLSRFTGNDTRYAPRNRAGEVIPIRVLDEELYADFTELEQERTRFDGELIRWVSELTEADIVKTVHYVRAGQPQEHPLFWALSHLFNHQTHHRGQVTTLFMQLGHDPGVTDLIAWWRLNPDPSFFAIAPAVTPG